LRQGLLRTGNPNGALSVIVCNTRGSKLSMPAKTESQVQRFRHAAAGALFGSFKHSIEKAEQ
jgi:hypothetical protein